MVRSVPAPSRGQTSMAAVVSSAHAPLAVRGPGGARHYRRRPPAAARALVRHRRLFSVLVAVHRHQLLRPLRLPRAGGPGSPDNLGNRARAVALATGSARRRIRENSGNRLRKIVWIPANSTMWGTPP